MSDSAEITHSESLWETLDVLRDSGQHGAKVCLGMANFLSERAAIETSYGNVRNNAESPLSFCIAVEILCGEWGTCARVTSRVKGDSEFLLRTLTP